MSIETVAAGRYRVERVLGHGGMAAVYLAHDTDLDRDVALKLLADPLAADAEFRNRFVREARLAARVSHPNIVQIYDAGDDEPRPYIVMEYVRGESLERVLDRRAKLPPAEAALLMAQAARGLQHAHAAGIVHRDVKPHNLLLRDDGVVKIADFGIALAAESTRFTRAGTILGTATYLAPEQALGEDVTAAADIYSLGAVLYELLTGRPPYELTSLADLATKQREGELTPVRDIEPAVPEELEALVMRCLARDPRFRPQSAAEVADELEGTAVSRTPVDGITAATVALPARVSSTVAGGAAWLWIAAAAVLAAIAVALGLSRIGGHGASSRPPTPSVEPIPHAATPAADARNLARWLRRHSR